MLHTWVALKAPLVIFHFWKHSLTNVIVTRLLSLHIPKTPYSTNSPIANSHPPTVKRTGCCEPWHLLRSLYFAPILFTSPGDRTPNLTTITVTTNYYTSYPMQRPWPRLLHSLIAVRLMFTSCQILHHAYHTASHLGTSCTSSPLYDPYLTSCSSHVLLMTRTRPIGYDPLI